MQQTSDKAHNTVALGTFHNYSDNDTDNTVEEITKINECIHVFRTMIGLMKA